MISIAPASSNTSPNTSPPAAPIPAFSATAPVDVSRGALTSSITPDEA
ncbi:MAG: hypothetical protein AAF652_05710 [Cyanobacteria bacterium P01_C01_bin.72]